MMHFTDIERAKRLESSEFGVEIVEDLILSGYRIHIVEEW